MVRRVRGGAVRAWAASSGGREAANLGRGGPAALEVGVAGRWVEVRDDLAFPFFIFYWTDKWAPIHASTYRTSSALTSGSHLSD
jgi:hypothetical protein